MNGPASAYEGRGNGTFAGSPNGSGAGTANGASVGTANGASAGTANGTSAGTANGTSAGTTNGTSAGTSNGTNAGTTNGTSAGTTNGTHIGDTPRPFTVANGYSPGNGYQPASPASIHSARSYNEFNPVGYDLLYKFLLIGDSGVGKTCLMCRFADQEFHPIHSSTIGIDFKMKSLSLDHRGRTFKVRLQIWDTAGQERYETITKQYYRKAQGVFLVYDITNERSFGNISKWMDFVAQYANNDVTVMLVGNKRDREDIRRISRDQGIKFAKEHGLHFSEASAFTDDNVEEMFETMTRELMRQQRHVDESRRGRASVQNGKGFPVTAEELGRGPGCSPPAGCACSLQ